MKIKTRLQLSAISVICITLVAGLLFFSATRRINESVRMVTFSDDVVREVFDLHLLTTEYLKYHEERARAQWQIKHESLTQLFTRVYAKEPEKQAIIERMRLSNERIESLLSQIIEIHNRLRPEDVHRKMDERLEGQLSIMLQALVADASKLDEASLEEIATAKKQTVNFIWIFVIALIATITATLFLISRSIVIPLTRLHRGAEIIGSGNLDYKVGTEVKDEIGRLSRAFDSMTDNLAKVMASRDELNREMEKRRQLEEALRESEKKYRGLVDNALVGVYQSNLKGNLLYANEALLRIYEFESLEDFISESAQKRYRNPADREVLTRGLKESGSVTNYEINALTKYGKSRDILISATLEGDVLSGMVVDITERKKAEEEKGKLIAELQNALAKIKTLSGLLPICSYCKKIRDDKGSWQQMELYVRDHTEAEFSHGMCPDCAKKAFKEVEEFKKGEIGKHYEE